MARRTQIQLLCSLFLLVGTGVRAADQAVLEEVIVTAQKREQSLQDVPIAVAAVDGSKIRDAGIQRIEELTAYVPNFKMAVTGQGNYVFIRGVGSGDNRGFEQSVGMFIDGIYAGRGQQFQTPFLDIARVEVLKGPQGTLFGKNTIAGAVNITTHPPAREFAAELAYSHNPELGAKEATLILNAPLGDRLAARLAYKTFSDDGYVDNFVTGEREAPRDEQTARLGLAWDASDRLGVQLKLEKSDFDLTGTTHQIIDKTGTFDLYLANFSLPASSPVPVSEPVISFNFEDEIDPRETGRLDREKSEKQFPWQPAFTENNSEAAVLTLNYQLGDAHALTSVTGYSQFDFLFQLDADFSDLEFIGTENTEDFEQVSQELRMTGALGERVDYIAGVYAHRQDLVSTLWLNLDFQALGVPSSLTLPGLSASFPAQLATFHTFTQRTDSMAVFGQVTWRILDSVSATMGLRWAQDEKSAHKHLDIAEFRSKERTANPLYAPIAGALNNSENHDIENERKVDSISPSLNLQWYPDPEIMTYFRYAKGFKDGGFNANDTTDSQEAFRYDDEEADTYELGIKSTLLNGAATLNAAAFYTEYFERQVSNFTLTGYVVGNAAESITQGIEVDLRWLATPRLMVGLSAAWLDSYFTSFVNGPCTAAQTNAAYADNNPDCRQDLTDQGTDYSPEYSASITGEYVQPLGGALELSLQIDLNYSDEYYYTQDRDESDLQEAYYKINGRLTLSHVDQRWQLALIGKNLTNEYTKPSGNDIPLFVGAHFAALDPPRSLALEASLRF